MQTYHIQRKGKSRSLRVVLLVLVAVSGCKTNTGTTSTAEKEKPFQTLVEQGDVFICRTAFRLHTKRKQSNL